MSKIASIKMRVLRLFPKKIHDHTKKKRSATWLELFFDLTLIGCVAILGSAIKAVHFDMATVISCLIFLIGFLSVYNIWKNATMYLSRFEDEGVLDLLFVFFNIFFMMMLAITFMRFDQMYWLFVTLFILSRLLSAIFWYCAALSTKNKNLRKYSSKYVLTAIIISILAFSILFFPQFAMPILALILALEIITPFMLAKYAKKMPSLAHYHIRERYGLLVILLLGDMFLSITHIVDGMTIAELPNLIMYVAFWLSIIVLFFLIYHKYILERYMIKDNINAINFFLILHIALAFSIILHILC